MTQVKSSQPFKYSTFKTVKDSFGTPHKSTWVEFKQRVKDYYQKTITNPTSKFGNNKTNSVIYLLAGETDDTNRRTALHIVNRTMITLDIDGYDGYLKQLQAAIKKCFKEYSYIAHNTSSTTFKEPRARVVLPLQVPIGKKEYCNLITTFINNLPVISIRKAINKDLTSSTKPHQLMGLHYHRANAKEEDSFYMENDGVFINLNNVPEVEITSTKPLSDIDNFKSLSVNTPLDISDEKLLDYIYRYGVEDSDYHKRLRLCQAIHNHYSGAKKGLDIYTKWRMSDSRIGTEYVEEIELRKCAEKYNSFKNDTTNPITMATIIKIVNEKHSLQVTNLPNITGGLNWVDTIGKKNTPTDIEENFRILLNNYNIKCSFNEILKKDEIFIENKDHIKDYDCNLSSVRSLMTKCRMPTGNHKELTRSECHINPTNPWRDGIINRIWDGINREEEFYQTITVLPKHESRKRLYMRKWIMQMLHITCFNDGLKSKRARGVLVFQGGELKGKTGWVESLTPTGLEGYIQTGKHVNIENQMDQLDLVSSPISELGELDGIFTKSAISALKNFLTRTEDKLNIKYKITHAHYRRRTVFYASVNKVDFLDGSEENTRFFVLPIINCNWDHKVDMSQLYAQFIELYKNDSYYLNDKELKDLINYNKNYVMLTPIIESFKSTFNVESDKRDTFFNGSEVMNICGRANSGRSELSLLCNYLSAQYKRNTNNGKYILPPLN